MGQVSPIITYDENQGLDRFARSDKGVLIDDFDLQLLLNSPKMTHIIHWR